MKLTPFEESYLETARWSETDDDGTPLDDSKYSDVELAAETVERVKADCESFIKQAEPLFADESLSMTAYHVAHDFWLTRNGHGAGFWDGDYPDELGRKLTKLSKTFGECNLYIGDDNKLYIE